MTKIKTSLIFICSILVIVQCSKKKSSINLDIDSPDKNIEVSIKDTAALAISAKLYFESKKFNEAISEYSKLISLDSTRGEFYYRRALSKCEIREMTESLEDFQKAASLDYKPFDSYYNLALINSVILLNDSVAILYLKRCLQINPHDSDAKNLLNKLQDKSKRT